MRFAFGEAHEQPAERHASGALVTRERNRKFADSPVEGNGFELPVLGFRSSIFYTAPETWSRKGPRSASRVLTTDNGRFTVHRARLAPAMISTPGHRASRRRQREALPAWRDFLGEQPEAAPSNPYTTPPRLHAYVAARQGSRWFLNLFVPHSVGERRGKGFG